MYDSPEFLGAPIYPEDLEVPRIPGRRPKGDPDGNLDNLLRVLASGQAGTIDLQGIWKHGLPLIRTVIEQPDPERPLRLAVPIDLRTGREIEMTEKERQHLILPSPPPGFTVSRSSREEYLRILRLYGWGGRLARRLRYGRWEFAPCPQCGKPRAPWHLYCPYCLAKWDSENTTIGASDAVSPLVKRLLDQAGVEDVALLNDRKVLVDVEQVYNALEMTAPGSKVVLPEMAAFIDEAKELGREQFRVLWCDYGKHVYFRDPSRGKACGFHMRVKRQRRSDGTLSTRVGK